jgi:hypothetical protein
MSLASAVEAFTGACNFINVRQKAHSYVMRAGLAPLTYPRSAANPQFAGRT